MASTVRIRDSDKKTLESLINYIAYKTNKKITQEEMVALLVKVGSSDRDKLMAEVEMIAETEEDWRDDPIFTVMPVQMGKDASLSVDKDVYS